MVRLPNEAGRYGVRLEGQKEPMSLHGRNMRPYLELCPLGVSLACLRSFAAEFHPLLKGALKGEMCGGLTLAQALESIVRPITEGAGASLAQVLNEVGAKDEANRPLAEKATLFVIAAPNDRFENVLEAVSGYLAKHDKPEDVYIWLNLFSQNAHCKVEASRRLITLGPPSNHTSNHTLITSHHTFSPHTLTTHSHHTLSPHNSRLQAAASLTSRPMPWWAHSFKRSLTTIGKVLVVVQPWSEPSICADPWSFYQLYLTLSLDDLPVSIADSSDDAKSLHAQLLGTNLNTPFPHMWRPHFSHMSGIEFFFVCFFSHSTHFSHMSEPIVPISHLEILLFKTISIVSPRRGTGCSTAAGASRSARTLRRRAS